MRQIFAAAIVFAATPALAQDRPTLYPTRDVSITYRVTSGPGLQGAQSGTPTMTMSWLASAQTMRMDMGAIGMPGYVVADHRGQRAFIVMEQQRMIMDLPMEQAMQQFGPTSTATFRRTGSDTVAGLSCTVWAMSDRGNDGTACITADGVMLRGQGTHQGQSGGMEATQVTYGTQSPARFQRPTGYQTMQIPGGAAPAPRR